jgi:hypothetical protein
VSGLALTDWDIDTSNLGPEVTCEALASKERRIATTNKVTRQAIDAPFVSAATEDSRKD